MADHQRRREAQQEQQEKRWRCQVGHVPAKPTTTTTTTTTSSSSSSCERPAKEDVDGLLLCEVHAQEAKLKGQIYCWEEMLFHIDLWSEEATRRGRQDVLGLIEVERTRALSARRRAHEDLDALGRGQTPRESRGPPTTTTRGLLYLPPGGARPPAPGLRHPRRR